MRGCSPRWITSAAVAPIVTSSSPQAAQNFGQPVHPPHHERYERARDYLDVITRLWDSWEDDALVNDPVSGTFADTSKIHAIDQLESIFAYAARSTSHGRRESRESGRLSGGSRLLVFQRLVFEIVLEVR